jgi:putative intracellular protease/amidase
MTTRLSVAVVLFEGFELLDVFGPLEMFGLLPEQFEIFLVAEEGDIISSSQGPKSLIDYHFANCPEFDILLVPGGRGTRREVDNPALLAWLQSQAQTAQYVTSVCTGSALLARAGLLDGRRATTNKAAFEWVVSQGERVDWQKQARWVEHDNYFTSSGISAGIDMSLALIAHLSGQETAEQVATLAEYEWHRDPAWDPFALKYGLV